jgi:hypothetical protein
VRPPTPCRGNSSRAGRGHAPLTCSGCAVATADSRTFGGSWRRCFTSRRFETTADDCRSTCRLGTRHPAARATAETRGTSMRSLSSRSDRPRGASRDASYRGAAHRTPVTGRKGVNERTLRIETWRCQTAGCRTPSVPGSYKVAVFLRPISRRVAEPTRHRPGAAAGHQLRTGYQGSRTELTRDTRRVSSSSS